MSKNIYLVNTWLDGISDTGTVVPYEIAAIEILENQLYEKGYNPITFLGTHEELSLEQTIEELLKGIEEDKPLAVAFSVASDFYHYFKHIVTKIREKYPDLPIIAGGPHFKANDPEALKKDLELADAICVDHSKPLDEFLRSIENGAFVFKDGRLSFENDVPLGFRVMQNQEMKGAGKGFPAMPLVAMINDSKGPGIAYTGEDVCPHHCEYCVVSRNKLPIEVDRVIGAIVERLEGMPKNMQSLTVNDSSPFSKPALEKTVEIFEGLKKKGYNPRKHIYLDLFDVERNWDKIAPLLRRYNVRDIFIGIDAPTQEGAEQIGRLMGKVVRPDNFHNSLNQLRKVVDFLDASQFRGTRPDWAYFHVALGYILHPFADAKQARETIDHVYQALSMSTQLVSIRSTQSILEPHAGSALRQRYKDKVAYFLDFEEHGRGRNLWPGLPGSPGSHFLDYVMAVNPDADRKNMGRFRFLMELCYELGYERFNVKTSPHMLRDLISGEDQRTRHTAEAILYMIGEDPSYSYGLVGGMAAGVALLRHELEKDDYFQIDNETQDFLIKRDKSMDLYKEPETAKKEIIAA